MSIDEEKLVLRRIAKKDRSSWAKKAGEGAAIRLKENFLRIFESSISRNRNSYIIAGFWPISDEIDVRPIIAELHKAGSLIGLPVVVGEGKPLIFRAWEPGLILDKGGFGTCHPSPEQAEVFPEVLLVPLLAFDMSGQRLGWGGGFYDRTISKLRAKGSVTTVGVAYNNQRVDYVPHMETDEPLDWIVTDLDVLEIMKP